MNFCRRLTSAGAIALVFLAVFLADAGAADMYQWVDENGTVWLADSLDKVPPEYRAWAYSQRKKVQEGPSITTPVQPKSGAAPAPESSASSKDPYADWRERLEKARAELDKLKAEREKTQTKRDTYTGDFYTRLFRGWEEDSKHRAKLAELDDLITQKEYELNTILDQARRAGVPSSVIPQ